MFCRTQWPSPEEYSQLEAQTNLGRTDIVRWFKDHRSALKNGKTLEWMEGFQNLVDQQKAGQQQNTHSSENNQSASSDEKGEFAGWCYFVCFKHFNKGLILLQCSFLFFIGLMFVRTPECRIHFFIRWKTTCLITSVLIEKQETERMLNERNKDGPKYRPSYCIFSWQQGAHLSFFPHHTYL